MMTIRRLTASAVGIAIVLGVAQASAHEFKGASASVGQGTVDSYASVGVGGVPTEIGIILSKGALDGLPPKPNNTSRCFDLDGNGRINETGECDGDYQSSLPFPAEVRERPDIPFDFAMVNWNPYGHPPEPWALPHFDIHFYQIPESAVDEIRVGACEIFIDCEDRERALVPVPAKYVHPEYVSVEAAVGRMGNHLIDVKTPEFGDPPATFTHTWIFGAYDGSVIFHEVMVTSDFLAGGGDACAPIKQQQAWEKAGYYPTRYCIRDAGEDGIRIFMDGFEMRPAG
ncbi:MAG: hypothetical protein GTN90_15790 [Xanthomonadales bacterium]|nr:hypothetical protein [Xanthomonadales bacterium]